jgi:hypothetical protein
LDYEQIISRAFIFVGVRNEEKCIAAPPTILSQNVYGVLRPETSEEFVGRLAKFLVSVVARVALVVTPTNVLDLLLLAVVGVTYVAQLLPPCSSASRRTTSQPSGAPRPEFS